MPSNHLVGKSPALGKKTVAALLVMGLSGQVAWTVENMYFNVFLYNTILPDTGIIALMVAASAVVATLTALLMGALSDRLGKRKGLIIGGYALWGLSIFAFRFLRPGDALLADAARRAALMVVGMDCVMTFFGSTANDAAFNAWATDVTLPANRGRAQGILSMLPLVSMLLVFGLLDPLTQKGQWDDFFLVVGLSTLMAGLAGVFLVEEPALAPVKTPVLSTIAHGFKASVIRANPMLYLALLALFVQSAATQVYMPYLIIYIQTFLGIKDYALILGVVLLGAALISLLSGLMIDRYGKARFAFPAAAAALAGMVVMFLARGAVGLMAGGLMMIGGSMALVACLNGLVQDGIPKGMGGRFQGVRMIFAVMLPMVTGPFLGSLVSSGSTRQYTELGVVRKVPLPAIFLAAAAVLLLIFPLLTMLSKKERKHDTPA